MHKFIVFILILNILPSFADGFNSKLKMNHPKTIISTYEANNHRNFLHSQHCPKCHFEENYLSSRDLNALEKYALDRTYQRENDLKRLERLENLAFGAAQSGNIFSRYKNVENAILSHPKQVQKRSFISNLANYFAGQTTGLTPSLMPYSSYNSLGGFNNNPYLFTPTPGYSNNNFEQYSNGIFSGGWGHMGQDYGTRSSIKMLD